MHSFNVSGPFERRPTDGRDEYGEKAMERDEGSSESSSLLPESQSEKKILTGYEVIREIKHEVMVKRKDEVIYFKKIHSPHRRFLGHGNRY